MYLVGHDGMVSIQCRRTGCLTDGMWLEIPLDPDVTPRQVEQIWMQHSLDHANLER